MRTIELPDDVFEMLESFGRSRGLSPADAVRAAVSDAAVTADQPAEFEMDDETRAWMDADLSRLGEHEPYDWGPDGPPKGKPIRYEPGVGFVVVGGKDKDA